MTKAINRDAIVSRVMEGVAIPASQFLPDGYFGVSTKLKPVAYDPDGAKKLLAEAGLADGFKLTLHTSERPLHQRRQDRRSRGADADPRRHRDRARGAAARGVLHARLARRAGQRRRSSASFWSAGRRRRARTRARWCRSSTPSTGPRAPAPPTAAATPIPRSTACPPRRSRPTMTPSAPRCWRRPPRSPSRMWRSFPRTTRSTPGPLRKGLKYKARSDEYTLATHVSGQ